MAARMYVEMEEISRATKTSNSSTPLDMRHMPTAAKRTSGKYSAGRSLVPSNTSKEMSIDTSTMLQITTWKKTLKASVCMVL
jgi:uncharacterized protein YbaP (TraB family)